MIFKRLTITFLLCWTIAPSFGTHIVGGEFWYECIDSAANLYRVSLLLYRDCSSPLAAEFDNPAYLGLYDTAGNLMNGPIGTDMTLLSRDTLLNTVSNICKAAPPGVCVEKGLYEVTMIIVPKAGGYHLVYQRCCRNDDIINIPNPLGTGFSWTVQIPDPGMAGCNNSPVFSIVPPTLICLQDSVIVDYRAVDPDGDSLTYELCSPKGSSVIVIDGSVPAPDPLPAFADMSYIQPYTFNNPLDPQPGNLVVDQGMIRGIANISGQFVTGICVKEYRNGNLLSTYIRDFNFNVANCLDTTPVADFMASTDTACIGDSIRFEVISPLGPAVKYTWNFGDAGGTSTEQTPVYAYQQAGDFDVSLSVSQGPACSADTLKQWFIHIADCAASGISDTQDVPTILVSPNPFKDRFLLEWSSIRPEILQIFDIQGQMVKQIRLNTTNRQQIMVEDLPPGCYIYRLNSSNSRPAYGKLVRY